MERHALLFEDEPALRTIFEELLARSGYRTEAYASPLLCPPERLAACHGDPVAPRFDLIVSDKNMPPINGLDFLERLVSGWEHRPPIALMSGYWSQGELERAHRLGFQTFEKPFVWLELAGWLESIERAAAHQRAFAE